MSGGTRGFQTICPLSSVREWWTFFPGGACNTLGGGILQERWEEIAILSKEKVRHKVVLIPQLPSRSPSR